MKGHEFRPYRICDQGGRDSKTKQGKRKNKMSRKNTVKAETVNSATPVMAPRARLVSPKGKVYEVENITKFANRFKLDRTAVSKLIHGRRASHKNWTAIAAE